MGDCACGLTKLGSMLDCALGAGDCLIVHWELGRLGTV